ncbi:hypothetical protein PHYBLDRAFT_72497 [Phycomyces blakesleeanus NRRL 1555(-)]|uniref:Uncharacterized protein n=1 Tax=Phycomyces blakesleeanus (strain ATCC 8743b / DSM 1359 / FGSC 10004 / NBRC 33097 / NRRL 1555) TaxID=763407 RepID=A0A162TZE6_PHYB8|nr:hypothetical protein PHYBLDRAFT_72497 [Phycomyces blakesleeanus NRRL 1555(-)]OAD71073.1 hypothetical protein PHYBLDRAFT_72497 [Phycomyces blakesleeanus NRRL 1555(-)]|eukprot:XP_018289113.1 hypothetical protein PHYBLDRAFT_72497 [Phycomyces blakesleeanus NRRL 1555(-)]
MQVLCLLLRCLRLYVYVCSDIPKTYRKRLTGLHSENIIFNFYRKFYDLLISTDNNIFADQSNDDNNSIDLDLFEELEKSQEFDDYQIDHYYLLNMPEDPNLAFIASFVATFISKYVVNSGGVILLKFINEVLVHFGQSFHLPLSLSGLNSMTGIDLLTRGLHCYVACSECNSVYLESTSVPLYCDA